MAKRPAQSMPEMRNRILAALGPDKRRRFWASLNSSRRYPRRELKWKSGIGLRGIYVGSLSNGRGEVIASDGTFHFWTASPALFRKLKTVPFGSLVSIECVAISRYRVDWKPWKALEPRRIVHAEGLIAPFAFQADGFICKRTGKRSYRTQLEAKAEIKRFQGRSGRQPHWVYQCDHCYGFHLTAEPPGKYSR